MPARPNKSLLPDHADLLTASGISTAVTEGRGYYSESMKSELGKLGFAHSQRICPALVIPLWGIDGSIADYQIRPTSPRLVKGNPAQYELPRESKTLIDVHPLARQGVLDTHAPLYLTVGVRNADAATSRGIPCAATITFADLTAHREFWEAALAVGREVFVIVKAAVLLSKAGQQQAVRISSLLKDAAAIPRFVGLPQQGDKEVGFDEFLAAGRTVADLLEHLVDECMFTPAPDGLSALYLWTKEGLYLLTTEKGETKRRLLTNFDAEITAEVRFADGTRELEVTARQGNRCSSCVIAASEFSRMEWITSGLGAGYVIVPPCLQNRDHVRAAMQLKGPIPQVPGFGWPGLAPGGGRLALCRCYGPRSPGFCERSST